MFRSHAQVFIQALAWASLALSFAAFAQAGPSQPLRDDGLSLESVLRRGLLGHPELQREWERLSARKAAVNAEWQPFSPQLQFSLIGADRQTPVAGPFLSFFYPEPYIRTQQLDSTVSLAGRLPVGTDYELQVGQSVFAYSSISEPFNPRLTGHVRLRLTQPLLRGFGTTQNLRELNRTRLELEEEASSARERLQDRAREVGEAFYATERARLMVELRKRSVETSTRFEEVTRKLISAGRQTQNDLLVAERTLKTRQNELLDAENRLADALRALDQVLREMGSEASQAVPSNPFEALEELPTDEEAFVQTALKHHPVLSRMRSQLQRAELEAERAKDDMQADIRIVAEGELNGLSGSVTCNGGYLPDGISMCGVPEMFRGGLDRQYANLVSGRFYAGRLGIEGTLPLSRAPLKSRQTQRSHQASELRYSLSLEERRMEILARRTFREFQERQQFMTSSEQIVSLAQKTATAEEAKLQAGRSTLFDVINAQEMVVGAEVQALDAKIQWAQTRFRAWVLAGTLHRALESALEGGGR